MGGRALAATVVVALMIAGMTPAYAGTADTRVVGVASGADRDAEAMTSSGALRALDDQLPAGTRVLVDRNGDRERRDTVTDLAAGVRGYHDRAAWLDAAADLTALVTGEDVAAASDHHHDEGEPAGKIVDVVPAGDLDADGSDDVLALTLDLQTEEVLVQARRGSDAGVLWERTAGADGALLWPLREDVDGDGTDDFVVEGLGIQSEHVVEKCEGEGDEEWCEPTEYHATFVWTLGVASGADGALLWSREEPGHLDEVYTL